MAPSAPWIVGGDGDDRLTGTAGRDLIDGGLGDDRLSGGAGNDVMFGDRDLYLIETAPGMPSTADRLDGGRGDDILIGGADNDVLTGGAGRDVFIGRSGGSLDLAFGPDYLPPGEDLVTDFVKGEDRLALTEENLYGDSGFQFLSFDMLDGNHDGVLTNADSGVQVARIDHDGQSAVSTVISFGGELGSTFTIFGVTGLTAQDFVAGDFDTWSPISLSRSPGQYVGSFDADQWQGTDAAEGYVGLHGDDVVHAGGGADEISGNAGDDRLFGDGGNDLLRGGSGDDRLDGGAGDDVLTGDEAGSSMDDFPYRFPSGVDQLDGGDGDDLLFGAGGADQLNGQAGRDIMIGGAGDDRLAGGVGDDVLFADGYGLYLGSYLEPDQDHLAGGSGNDILFAGHRSILMGDAGRDVFVKALDAAAGEATNHSIVMDFARGQDRLALTTSTDGFQRYLSFAEFDTNHDGVLDAGDAGHVRIQTVTQGGIAKLSTILFNGAAATEKLVLFGVTGLTADDVVAGTATLVQDSSLDYYGGLFRFGSFDADNVQGSAQDERIELFHGADRAYAAGGDDLVLGDSGDDVLFGGEGRDRLWGGTGQDRLYGEAGDDALSGDDGNDVLKGGSGNDTLDGGAGDDRLEGGNGDDHLGGSSGIDFLTGDGGSDHFSLDIGHDGRILVTDFTHGADELILYAYGQRLQSFPDSIAGLDTNHDGTLGAGDRGFLVKQVEVGGVTSTALILDTSKLVGAAGNAHLTVLGIDHLLPGDVDIRRY